MDKQMDRQMDDGWINGLTDGQVNGQVDGWMWEYFSSIDNHKSPAIAPKDYSLE